MRLLRGASDALRFVAELGVYAGVATAAVTSAAPPILRAVLAICGVVIMAAVWGLCAAPKAKHPLRGAPRTVFEGGWFGIGVIALWRGGGGWWWAVLLASAALVSGFGRWATRNDAPSR